LEEHRKGYAAVLTCYAIHEGIELILARTWAGDRKLERKLKRRKEGPRLCPICRGETAN